MPIVKEWLLLKRISKGKNKKKSIKESRILLCLSLKRSKEFQGEAL